MPIQASRHYTGPGLGEGAWRCPACGVENAGPLVGGCSVCGAGRPGQRATEERPASVTSPLEVSAQWAAQHPQATLVEAFAAGYAHGVQATHAQLRAEARRSTPAADPFAPERKIQRTLVAALEVFRDRILPEAGEAIESGEWCSIAEVTTLIAELQAREVVHA